jgi:hypothetical protein
MTFQRPDVWLLPHPGKDANLTALLWVQVGGLWGWQTIASWSPSVKQKGRPEGTRGKFSIDCYPQQLAQICPLGNKSGFKATWKPVFFPALWALHRQIFKGEKGSM